MPPPRLGRILSLGETDGSLTRRAAPLSARRACKRARAMAQRGARLVSSYCVYFLGKRDRFLPIRRIDRKILGMAEPPTTRPSLLLRLRDVRDGQAWTEFVDLYAPLVYGFARKQGLQDADAADLTQEVLRAVSKSIGRLDYDPSRGSFRAWLFAVVRSKMSDLLAARTRQPQGSGDTDANHRLAEAPAPHEDGDEDWSREHEHRLFVWAAEKVRTEVTESTWRAFWLTAVEGKRGQVVARELGLSVAAVYLAKSRVMARIKDQILPLQEEDLGATK